ncbi:MAG: ferredoxin [Candidatus Methanomethylicota archaeon]|nr:NADH-quinone oxidoreductase subunit I [Candidatus Culexmicrobium cathedralense]RLE48432.1 MAG: ferredoxin [Candidatus Verstraetearchaeota archaeon]
MAMIREIWRNFPKRPATLKYPFERLEPSERYRGKHHFDPKLCVGCGLCARDCPAKAIEMVTFSDGKRRPVFYLDRCIFCAVCERICPRNAIKLTKFYELATYDKSELVLKEALEPEK